ncbi:MAG: MATE family efflux transporter, partial [Desulfococcus multivorans]|jgi:MATE family multidrug resistance protein|nr:MATE family efflux transporter [Desulfococcus multivorans]
VTGFFYLVWPRWTLSLFQTPQLAPAASARMTEMGVILLRFVAFYIFFDAQYMIRTGALKGAGDTRFIMWANGVLSIVVMILPIYIGIFFLDMGIYFAWSCVVCFIVSLFTAAFIRFRRGRWLAMRVIEPAEARK